MKEPNYVSENGRMNALAAAWLLHNDHVFFSSRQIVWANGVHDIVGAQLNASTMDSVPQFMADYARYTAGVMDAMAAFESDEGLRIPRDTIAASLYGAIREGDLTGATLFNLVACGRALCLESSDERTYTVTYDDRLARGIPGFYRAIARLLWDMRAYNALTGAFDVAFVATRATSANPYLGTSETVVRGAELREDFTQRVDARPDLQQALEEAADDSGDAAGQREEAQPDHRDEGGDEDDHPRAWRGKHVAAEALAPEDAPSKTLPDDQAAPLADGADDGGELVNGAELVDGADPLAEEAMPEDEGAFEAEGMQAKSDETALQSEAVPELQAAESIEADGASMPERTADGELPPDEDPEVDEEEATARLRREIVELEGRLAKLGPFSFGKKRDLSARLREKQAELVRAQKEWAAQARSRACRRILRELRECQAAIEEALAQKGEGQAEVFSAAEEEAAVVLSQVKTLEGEIAKMGAFSFGRKRNAVARLEGLRKRFDELVAQAALERQELEEARRQRAKAIDAKVERLKERIRELKDEAAPLFAAPLRGYGVGSVVEFGSMPAHDGQAERIRWRVAELGEDYLILASESPLSAAAFGGSPDADLAAWVKESFAQQAFSSEELIILKGDPWVPEGNLAEGGVRPAVRVYLGVQEHEDPDDVV